MDSKPSNELDFIGYLKYEGVLVDGGIIAARAASEALDGFDGALRFFIGREQPRLARVDFPIPVRIENGSWEALIPTTLGHWLEIAFAVGLGSYLKSAGKKMAERDFDGIGFKDLLSKAMEGLQWFVKIAKHLGTTKLRPVSKLRWRNNNEEVGIPNSDGQVLFVPVAFYEFFLEAPPRLLSDIARHIQPEQIVKIGRDVDGLVEEVTIGADEKEIFYAGTEEAETILFPELKHGQPVSLEGIVTRENGPANSIGFRYNDHILTGYPREGNVT